MTPEQVKPDKRGYLRCPWDCHTNASPYPAPKWKTLAGLTRHMEGCHKRPPPEYVPPPPPAVERWKDCEDCGAEILVGDPIWMEAGKSLCWNCRRQPGEGYCDCAGLLLPNEYIDA